VNDDAQRMNERDPDAPAKEAAQLARELRMKEIIDDAARRLRGVCAHMSEAEFQGLMREIAAIAVKYEAQANLLAARRPSPPTT